MKYMKREKHVKGEEMEFKGGREEDTGKSKARRGNCVEELNKKQMDIHEK